MQGSDVENSDWYRL